MMDTLQSNVFEISGLFPGFLQGTVMNTPTPSFMVTPHTKFYGHAHTKFNGHAPTLSLWSRPHTKALMLVCLLICFASHHKLLSKNFQTQKTCLRSA